MNGVGLVFAIAEIIANVQCESDSISNHQSIVRGIAAKIGFPPTVLKVFIRGDIPAEEIAKLLNLYAREDKVPKDSDLTRNRRNSITDYIEKLYSYNNLFRPYRSIFRNFKQVQTTKIPWLKRFLGVRELPREESKTESFWGMALGAHTFSPFVRPLAQTRIPYHRIRNQQRIDKLLGITRKYGNLALHHETKAYQWIKNKEKFDQIIGQAKSEETTTTVNEHSKNATTRKAFHKAPLDVAGLKSTFFPHLHAITTPRRLKFCEKQCAGELEEVRTKQPPSTERPRPSNAWEQHRTARIGENTADSVRSTDKPATTERCTCTCSEDYLSDEIESERDCKGKCLHVMESGWAVTKNVGQTKRATYKATTLRMTTSKFTKSKERRPTGPVWTLPSNSVLDEVTPEEQRRTKVTTEDGTDLMNTKAHTTSLQDTTQRKSTLEQEESDTQETRKSQTCMHGKSTNRKLCIPLPIPTRVRLPLCLDHPKSTKRCTRKTTTAEENCNTPCDCQTRKPPPENVPISIGVPSVDQHNEPGECKQGKPQKIIVRISSALGEVPVVIMRDNGVPGVSLSLVNDYLLDENNRLIKCLSQKPLKGRMNLNALNKLTKPVRHSKVCKNKNCLPNLMNHQLHSLQPKLFRTRCKSKQRPVSNSRAAIKNGNLVEIPNTALNQDAFSGSNPFPSYKLSLPESGLGSFGLQYPAMQNPRSWPFKMDPARLNLIELPQVDVPGNNIGPKEYPRFNANPGRMSLSAFGPSRLNLQPAYSPQIPDTSHLMGYRSPFLPMFYSNQNAAQPQKYSLG